MYISICMYDPPYIERWYRVTGAYLAPPASPHPGDASDPSWDSAASTASLSPSLLPI